MRTSVKELRKLIFDQVLKPRLSCAFEIGVYPSVCLFDLPYHF